MSTTALFTHVPVDRFTVIDGPGRRAFSKLPKEDRSGQMRSGKNIFVEFTLTTPASKLSFTRDVELCAIVSGEGNKLLLLGIFCGELVNIDYDVHTRSGILY